MAKKRRSTRRRVKRRKTKKRKKRPNRRRPQRTRRRSRRTKKKRTRRPTRRRSKKKRRRRTTRRKNRKKRKSKRRRTTRRKSRPKKKRRSVRRKKRRPRRKKRSRRSRKRFTRRRRKKAIVRKRRNWANWPTEKLLDVRICDLGLQIPRTELAARIRQLYSELKRKGFVYFRPHCWLSDEWYSPDGVPGIAIPFFLAHPRLRRLEKEFMLEVEGGTREWSMKLLRHEAAHALLNAYQLQRRRDWQKVFGRSSAKYPDTYLPKPYSKSYVMHLENWYAQAHPHEDWAETFAVWVRPGSDWKRRYKGWPALRKLEFVDSLMREIMAKRPKVRNRREELSVRSMRTTLRQYYQDKQERYAADSPEFFDRDLRRLFSDAEEHKKNERASRYVRRVSDNIIDIVGKWTSEYHYRINEVLEEMIERCDELKLRVARSDEEMKPEMVACLTMLVMNKLHSGGFHISL